MIFTVDVLLKVIIFLLGIAGYLVARHIRSEKRAERPLVCPIHFDCNAVVNSDYSKFLGVPVEIFGMIYYLLLSVSYAFFIVLPDVLSNTMVGIAALASLGAFIFSMYLISIQIFVLKKGCSWCFVSAFICVLIFVCTIWSYDFSALGNILIK